MKLLLACLTAVLLSCPALASAQTTAKSAAKGELRERALKRCKENRGINCESKKVLSEWMREERPITREEQRAAAAARRQREECAKAKYRSGC